MRSGDKIGPYTLISKIGQGAFGVVWLAERRTSIITTQFALKVPLDEDIDMEVIKQEAAIWVQALGHPNVLPIIEADVYDNQIVIVSEYAPDGSLDHWLVRHKGQTPSVEAAVEMASGILAGLEHLHARRIIHRDLKPSNILLQNETPRLADFGIARVLKSSTPNTFVRGTPAYMAPEAFDGKRTEQTDVWSAGIVLYRLLSGRLPFPQKDITSLIGAITRYDPTPLPCSVPKPLQETIARALQKDPAQRYKSAADMHKALQEAKSGQSRWATVSQSSLLAEAIPQIEHSQTSTLLMQPARKSNRLTWIISGIFALLVIGIIITVFIARTRPEQQLEESKTSGKSEPSKELKRTLTGHSNGVYSVAFSPDAKILASGSSDKTVKLWDVETGELKQTLTGHSNGVYSVAFSPDAKILASGSSDKTVKLWDVETGELKQTLTGHSNTVSSLSFSTDGKTLLSGSDDKTVKVWDVQTGKLEKTLKGIDDDDVETGALSPDSKIVASASLSNTVKLRNVETREVKLTLTGHRWTVTSVVFSTDGKILASGSLDRTVKLWDMSGLK